MNPAAAAGGPNQPVRPFYLSPYVIDLIAKWDAFQIEELLDLIEEAEETKSPKPHKSRLLAENKATWREHSIMLLAQRERLVIRSLLDKTLPQRLVRNEVRAPVIQPKDSVQPLIYANMIADQHGMGLTCDDFEWALAAMEVGLSLRADPANRTTVVGGRTVEVGVDHEYSSFKPGATVGFWQDLRQTKPKSKIPSLTNNVRRFVTENRQMLADARTAGIDHVIFQPEIGWGYKGYTRMKDHKKLNSSSPAILRYLQLVLWHLFPAKGFTLHQYILFDVWHEVQAGIGESLGSQIGESYIQRGGVNFEQAGISDNASWKMEARLWYDFRAKLDTNAYRATVLGRLQTMYDRTDLKAQDDQDLVERHELQGQLNRVRNVQIVHINNLLELAIKSKNALVELHDQELSRLDAQMLKLKEEDERLAQFDADFYQLAKIQGVVPPSNSQQATQDGDGDDDVTMTD